MSVLEGLEAQVRAELKGQRGMMNYVPHREVGHVVVLSAPHTILPMNKVLEANDENQARVVHAMSVIEAAVSVNLVCKVTDVTHEQMLAQGVRLCLNGETEQLPALVEMACWAGCPAELIDLVDSGLRGESHTKNQFEKMRDDRRYADGNLVIVTSGYHVPRVRRTAKNLLGKSSYWEVAGVPFDYYPWTTATEDDEVKRILAYVEKGDIARDPM